MAESRLRRANTARQQEWDLGDQLTLSFRGNELAGEVGEACNAIKKLERERLGIAGSRDTVDHLAEELADVVICTDLIAMQAGIDLDAAVVAKFNATSEKVGLLTRMFPPTTEGVGRQLWHELLVRAPRYTTAGRAFVSVERIEQILTEVFGGRVP